VTTSTTDATVNPPCIQSRSPWLDSPDTIKEAAFKDTGKFGSILSKQLFKEIPTTEATIRFEPLAKIFEINWHRGPTAGDTALIQKIVDYRNSASVLQNLGFSASVIAPQNTAKSNATSIQILNSVEEKSRIQKEASEVYNNTLQKYEYCLKSIDDFTSKLDAQIFTSCEYATIDRNIRDLKNDLLAARIPENISKLRQKALAHEQTVICESADALIQSVAGCKNTVQRAQDAIRRIGVLYNDPSNRKLIPQELENLERLLAGKPNAYRNIFLGETNALLQSNLQTWPNEEIYQLLAVIRPGSNLQTLCNFLDNLNPLAREGFYQSLSVEEKVDMVNAFCNQLTTSSSENHALTPYFRALLGSCDGAQFKKLMATFSPRDSSKNVLHILENTDPELRADYFRGLDLYHKHDLLESLKKYCKSGSAKAIHLGFMTNLTSRQQRTLFPSMTIEKLNKRTMSRLIKLPEVIKQKYVEKTDDELLCSIGFCEISPKNVVYVRMGGIDRFQPYDITTLAKYIKSEINAGRNPTNIETREALSISSIYRN
jgi:hypothetical protein